MAVGAEDAGAIRIVEQHKIPDQLMLVGRDLLAKCAERRRAVALREIAQNLIVGAVFLDDIHDVLEDAGLADTLGNGAGRLV